VVAILASSLADHYRNIDQRATSGKRASTAVSIIAAAALAICPPTGVRSDCVVDGDTVWFGRTKVRIENIDTPEIGQAKCAYERKLGERARDRLLAILSAGAYRVIYSGRSDRFGRPLVRIAIDGKDVGDQLVAEGLARKWEGRRRSWC